MTARNNAQRFERDDKIFTLVRIASGRAVTRGTYLGGPRAWDAWFDVCKDGGHDPYKVRQQYRVEQIGGGT